MSQPLVECQLPSNVVSSQQLANHGVWFAFKKGEAPMDLVNTLNCIKTDDRKMVWIPRRTGTDNYDWKPLPSRKGFGGASDIEILRSGRGV